MLDVKQDIDFFHMIKWTFTVNVDHVQIQWHRQAFCFQTV